MVTFVTPLVNPVNPPRTPDENDETLFTTEAAKDDPGMEGMETVGRLPDPPMDGNEAVAVPLVGVLTVVAGLGTAGS